MTPTEIVKLIAEWCSDNGHSESRFLTPTPQHQVYTFDLFNMLAERTGIPADEIGAWFNARQEENAKP